MMFYYFSIGTNIEPEHNAVNIVKMLSQHFGPIVIYPFVYTQPQNIVSQNVFLNSIAIALSPKNEVEVKNILNSIEITLGRDRSDPQRSKKDRVADIDILGFSKDQDNNFLDQQKELYIKEVIDTQSHSVDLTSFGLPSSKGPATVDFDTTSSHIRILQNAADSLIDWHKASLVLQ